MTAKRASKTAKPTSDLTFLATHLMDRARAMYNWQNYHLWSVLTRKNYRPAAPLTFTFIGTRTPESASCLNCLQRVTWPRHC